MTQHPISTDLVEVTDADLDSPTLSAMLIPERRLLEYYLPAPYAHPFELVAQRIAVTRSPQNIQDLQVVATEINRWFDRYYPMPDNYISYLTSYKSQINFKLLHNNDEQLTFIEVHELTAEGALIATIPVTPVRMIEDGEEAARLGYAIFRGRWGDVQDWMEGSSSEDE